MPLIAVFSLSLASSDEVALHTKALLCPESPVMSHEFFLCIRKNKIVGEAQQLSTDQILDDELFRVANDFKIKPNMRDRVRFWFDVYTKYDSNKRIIHHSDYPWVIYKIVDVSDVMARPKAKWVNNLKAEAIVKHEVLKVKASLAKIQRKLKRKNLSDILFQLNEDERYLVQLFQNLKGGYKKNILQSLSNVRVQVGQKDYYSQGLVRYLRFKPTMERIFLEYRLPVELTALPLVESSFNDLATSKAGAVGVWQFMPGTGKKFLTVNENIDERRSPFKSTDAAAELLKENYLLFQNWPLALTAYNHGPGGVRRAVKKARTTDIGEIVSIYETRNFSFASQNYYAEFQAAMFAEKYVKEVFGSSMVTSDVAFERIDLPRRLKIEKILEWTQSSLSDFAELNPDLKKIIRRGAFVPKFFSIYLTPERAFLFRSEERRQLGSLPDSDKGLFSAQNE